MRLECAEEDEEEVEAVARERERVRLRRVRVANMIWETCFVAFRGEGLRWSLISLRVGDELIVLLNRWW